MFFSCSASCDSVSSFMFYNLCGPCPDSRLNGVLGSHCAGVMFVCDAITSKGLRISKTNTCGAV